MALAQLKTRWFAWPVALSAAAAVCLALLWVSPPVASAAEDEAAWMYNPNQVVEINLGGISPEEEEKLEEEKYVKGTFELKAGGETKGSLAEVGIKLRGTGSYRPFKTGKAAFKIKFDKYVEGQSFFGIKTLTTNNMVQDPSMIHETLAYEMFHAFGVPSTRTGYAFIRVNGVKYGVYLNIETMDSVSMPLLFSSTQSLYKADNPGTDVRPEQADTFEVAIEGTGGLGDLEALIADANNHSGDWSDRMSGVADLPEMTRMWAVERYIGHWDGYAGRAWIDEFRPNNYFLHSDAAGIFAMLPWGTDQTWASDPAVGTRLSFGEPAGGRMFNYCYEDASCKELYVRALEGIYGGVSGVPLDAHAAALAQMLAPYQAEEEEPRREFGAAEIAKGVADTRKFIAERPGELFNYLHPPKPAPVPPAPLPRRPKIGSTHIRGAVVFTHLTVFEPGRAVQRVTTGIAGHRMKACIGKKVAKRAGRLTVSCRLSHRVRGLRKVRRLRLKVRVGFVANRGVSTFKTNRLTLRRQP